MHPPTTRTAGGPQSDQKALFLGDTTMLNLGLNKVNKVLCLGAHPDDIEIGCGGTMLRLARENPALQVYWAVFSAGGSRDQEAHAGANHFLQGICERVVDVQRFRDRLFPTAWEEMKEHVDRIRRSFRPDLIFTHRRDDVHQDHRVLAELTWCTFRDHWILEYEIPKYDGDLGNPNVFVPLTESVARNKADMIVDAFASQHEKPWFCRETLMALARIRGVEAAAPDKYAEGFYCRKITL